MHTYALHAARSSLLLRQERHDGNHGDRCYQKEPRGPSATSLGVGRCLLPGRRGLRRLILCGLDDHLWESSRKSFVFLLKACDVSARRCRSATDVSIEPTVGVDSSMKESTPLRMEATDQAGTHDSGWKSLIERHSLVFVEKRPFGVSIMMDGGAYG